MIIHKIQTICKRLLTSERSVTRLAQSSCLGVFIAFSPYIGFHTLMAICLCWLLSLNYAVTLAVQLLINNPWTMVPIYSCDYVVGRMINALCKGALLADMPVGLHTLLDPICSRVGIPVGSIWTFLVGGNVLSIILALSLYWPFKWLFERIAHENHSAE